MRSGGPLRRVGVTLAVYVLSASLVLGTARAVAELLVLPPLFLTILAGMTVLGLPLAAWLAWTYEPPSDGT